MTYHSRHDIIAKDTQIIMMMMASDMQKQGLIANDLKEEKKEIFFYKYKNNAAVP